MPLTAADMATSLFQVRSEPNPALQYATDGTSHRIYAANACRTSLAIAVMGGQSMISVTSNPAGDTLYLPFEPNQISSMRVPDPATLPGVTTFLTASLSGCKVFVDTIGGSNDLMVYHANAQQQSVGLELNPNVEPRAATTTLNDLHSNAQTYYRNPPNNLTLTNAAELAKPRYGRTAQLLVNSKFGPGHYNREFWGGTLVAGFVQGGAWQFWFQTFGDVAYDRSILNVKRWKGADASRGVANLNFRVLEASRFYP